MIPSHCEPDKYYQPDSDRCSEGLKQVTLNRLTISLDFLKGVWDKITISGEVSGLVHNSIYSMPFCFVTQSVFMVWFISESNSVEMQPTSNNYALLHLVFSTVPFPASKNTGNHQILLFLCVYYFVTTTKQLDSSRPIASEQSIVNHRHDTTFNLV